MNSGNRQTMVNLIRGFETRHGVATALTEAARWGLHEEVVRLLDSGVDPNARLEDGGTAIMLASSSRIAKLLVSRGADINARDDNGRTALIWALLGLMKPKHARSYFETLLSLGADVSVISDEGELAEELARDKYGEEMAHLLKKND